MARAPITAVQAQPPGYSLLQVVTPITDSSDRWEMFGAEWRPEQCGAGGRLSADCGIPDGELEPGDGEELGFAEPFLVFGSAWCRSPFGFPSADWGGEARRNLLATQSAQIAAELWGGSLNGATSEDGTALNDSGSTTVTGGSAVDVIRAVAELEEGLADCTNGRRAMIHMPPRVLALAAAANAVRLAGNLWVTAMGNIVVADAGYDGSAPGGGAASGGEAWVYATGQVNVYLGDIDMNPNAADSAQQLLAGALNTRNNEVQVFAQRLALVQWDPCCWLAARVDVTATNITP